MEHQEFTITKAFDVENYDGSRDNLSMTIKPHGYWSRDAITFYIECDMFDDSREARWKVKENHSAGGRDNEELADDAQAAINFGTALVWGANHAKEILAKEEARLQRIRAEYLLKLQAKWKARQEAKEAAVEADPAMGEKAAAEMINELIRRRNEGLEIAMVRRGEATSTKEIKVSPFGNATLYILGRVSRAEAIKELSEMSTKSKLVVRGSAKNDW